MNDINRVTNYSLIALLVLTMVAFVYVANIVKVNPSVSGSNSKVVAAFNA